MLGTLRQTSGQESPNSVLTFKDTDLKKIDFFVSDIKAGGVEMKVESHWKQPLSSDRSRGGQKSPSLTSLM